MTTETTRRTFLGQGLTLPALLTLGQAPAIAQINLVPALLLRSQLGQPDDGVHADPLRGHHRRGEKKQSALFAHKSQHGDAIYREHHEIMENFRGREVRAAAAVAFVLLPSPKGAQKLPGT